MTVPGLSPGSHVPESSAMSVSALAVNTLSNKVNFIPGACGYYDGTKIEKMETLSLSFPIPKKTNVNVDNRVRIMSPLFT